jgi:chaperonin GroES
MEPFHDRVLVRRFGEKEAVSPAGIITPEIAREKPIEGEVLAVGQGRILENGTKIPLDAKVGDKVLFGKFAGTKVPESAHEGVPLEKGEEVIILREDEILGRTERA